MVQVFGSARSLDGGSAGSLHLGRGGRAENVCEDVGRADFFWGKQTGRRVGLSRF